MPTLIVPATYLAPSLFGPVASNPYYGATLPLSLLSPLWATPVAGPAVASIPRAGDLLEAVQAILQASLVAPGTITWAGTGLAVKGTLPPYVRIGDLDEQPDYQEDGSGHAPFDDLGTLAVLCVHSTSDQCRALSRQVSAALTDPVYALDEGELLMLRRTARGSPIFDRDTSIDGGGCWISHLMFASIVAKTL